jgi:hypothetical protein
MTTKPKAIRVTLYLKDGAQYRRVKRAAKKKSLRLVTFLREAAMKEADLVLEAGESPRGTKRNAA